ncbi:MAG: ABC transporter permease [Candidatus Margulisbacteria bacterium]|nr:ABC transporter permease [Candidatus Margulisiibacteriota bacterium]
MLIIKIAWRNIIKNLRKSLVTLILGVMCCTLMVFYESFNEGSRGKMIDDSVAMFDGYLQIHGKDYQDHPNYDNLIYDVAEVKEKIKDIKGIKSYTTRLQTFALYSGKGDSVGGMLVGVDPSTEKDISRIIRGLQDGRFLKDNDTNAVYIGKDLAKKLEVGLGDEVVIISSAVDYSMAATKLRVCGIFQTNFFEFDSRAAFINKKFMDTEFLADNVASHIVIQPDKKDNTFILQKKIIGVLDKKKYEVFSWREMADDLVQFMKIDYTFDHISFALLLIIVFFVIMIFSLISIFQRSKEIGIMRAIGTTHKQVYLILFTEILILAVISVILGGIFGSMIALHFQNHPIVLNFDSDLMDMYKQWGIYDLTMPAKLNMKSFLSGVIPVFLLILLAVWYPAWKVNQLKPIEAIEERKYV